MAIINYTDQLKYTGKGYLDSKMMPVKTYDDLKNIPITQRFEGLTITVLNDGNPQDYWLIGGVSNKYWIPKTSTNFNELKLALEDGFLKLKNGDSELGEAINLNDFFPNGDNSNDLYIDSVEYTDNDSDGNAGIFMCFTYSDGTKKYLNISQFISQTYEPGDGIVINGNVISIDSVFTSRLEDVEEKTIKVSDEIVTLKSRVDALGVKINEMDSEIANKATKNELNAIATEIEDVKTSIENNTNDINTNTIDISVLKERVNALTSSVEGSTPDGETIGITDDERKALYVKILNKDGNMLSVESEEGETGLCAFMPIYCEDEEVYE